VAGTFDEARKKLALFSYDCMLLNIMLPDGNGINLLKLLRKEGGREQYNNHFGSERA
jgi:DNA-binding response OmpR family regulator